VTGDPASSAGSSGAGRPGTGAGHHGARGRDATQTLTHAKPGPPRLTPHTPQRALLTAALDVGVPPGDA